MLRILSWLVGIALVALVLFLFFGGLFFQKAGNALINAINGTAAHGVAQVVPSNAGSTSDVQVNLQGLTSQSDYDVTLDENKCGGTVVQDLGQVTPDTNGNVTATFTVPDVSKYAQQPLWVDVHQGPDASYQSAACGQVQLNSSSTNSSTAPQGVSNTSGGSSSPSSTGLPNTGVAPGGSNSYDNYTFPRKY
jgi:hypothetical protein